MKRIGLVREYAFTGKQRTRYSDEGIFFKKIRKITYLGLKDVYDIEIGNTHSFIAEGILCHNSERVRRSLLRSEAPGVPYDTLFSIKDGYWRERVL